MARHSDGSRLLTREEAATYLGVSQSTFDRWTKLSLLPSLPAAVLVVGGMRRWDRHDLDAAIAKLPREGERDPETETGEWEV